MFRDRFILQIFPGVKCHSCRNHGTVLQYLQFFLELNFFSCRSLHPHETILLGVTSTIKWTTYHVRCINVTQGNNPYFNYLFTSFMRMLFTTPISIKVFIVPIDTGGRLNVHKTFRRRGCTVTSYGFFCYLIFAYYGVWSIVLFAIYGFFFIVFYLLI